MSYEKHEWVNNEVITAEKLNHMEDGIADGGSADFVIAFSGSNATFDPAADRTWSETVAAYTSGKRIRCKYIDADSGELELTTQLQFTDGNLSVVTAAATVTTFISVNSMMVISILCEFRLSSVAINNVTAEVAATVVS